MSPTLDFLHEADRHIRMTLEKVRPQLLEAQGNIEHHLKDDSSAVTEMDTFVEAQLRDALQAFDKSIGFSGEEGGVDYDQKTFWLVDPIDGTEQFIRGIPMATNMVALIDNGEPILSVIYNFTLGDYYLAIKGHGATCNGHSIHVSNRTADRAWVTMTASNAKSGVPGLRDKLSEQVSRVRNFGAAGYQYPLVASGATEAHIQFNGSGHEWDFAPGALLVQEAGARIANIGSDTYNYREHNHIAANPVIFDQLMEFMVKAERDAKDIAA
jgi:fructose-1,6-bisphosphatase/inositol monophosphatase family enzyme